jgi:hypothetical protein
MNHMSTYTPVPRQWLESSPLASFSDRYPGTWIVPRDMV